MLKLAKGRSQPQPCTTRLRLYCFHHDLFNSSHVVRRCVVRKSVESCQRAVSDSKSTATEETADPIAVDMDLLSRQLREIINPFTFTRNPTRLLRRYTQSCVN